MKILSFEEWYETMEEDLRIMAAEFGYDLEDDWMDSKYYWYVEQYDLYQKKMQTGIK